MSKQKSSAEEIEERHKAATIRARESGIKGANYQIERRGVVQPAGGSGWFKRSLEAMDPRTWKSKKTVAHEAEVEKKRLEREVADAEKAKKAIA